MRIEVLQAGASPAFPAFKTPSLETFLQVLIQFSLSVLSLFSYFLYFFLIFENSILKQRTHLEPDFQTNLISLKIQPICYYTPTNTGQKFPLLFNSFESLVMRSHCKSVTSNMMVSVFLFRRRCGIDSEVKGSWMLQNIAPGKHHFSQSPWLFC